jgi:UDPglucose 6-dehydrogenase
MKIAVIGTGYVGLVTGTCLSETGNIVTCVDINKQKVQMMQQGQLPIY